MQAMAETGRNARYLPQSALPPSLHYSADLAASIVDADWVLVVTPSHAFRELVEQLATLPSRFRGLAWATKVSSRVPAASCTSSSKRSCPDSRGRS